MTSEKTMRALVTGASRGIGRAVTLKLLQMGCQVYAAARNREALKQLEQEAAVNMPGRCIIRSGDAGDERFVKALFEEIAPDGPLDILINNAGISYVGLLQDMKLAEWNLLFQTNITAMFLTCREAIPMFLRQGGGSIVNVSSVWGSIGAACETAYSATKGAVDSFTRALAKELAPSNIRVNAAAFGTIDTSMNAFLSDADRSALADEIGMGRFGSPEEAADLICDLAINHPYMTGQIVRLDGGWT